MPTDLAAVDSSSAGVGALIMTILLAVLRWYSPSLVAMLAGLKVPAPKPEAPTPVPTPVPPADGVTVPAQRVPADLLKILDRPGALLFLTMASKVIPTDLDDYLLEQAVKLRQSHKDAARPAA